jgi:hypothetical protein
MSMRFADLQLQAALVQWRQIVDVLKRSEADNIWFEQRISEPRQSAFEREASGATDATSLRNAHSDYWRTFVLVDEDVPHTFVAALGPADLGAIDETQKIVRMESLVRPLAAHGIAFEELKAAFDNKDVTVVDGFLRVWNASNVRDWRPAFAAFKDELSDDLVDRI